MNEINEQEMFEMLDQVFYRKVVAEKTELQKTRRLPFSGAKNFRDLGGYQTLNRKTVRWGVLYRSDGLHKLTDADQKRLSALSLDRVIDFRAAHEKEREPDRLPADTNIRRVEIPILDSSTKVWHDSHEEFEQNLKNIDPAIYMIETNAELATRFTPEMRQFIRELLASNGQPVLFHCAAGKDRTGFAAAILLRLLGVPQAVVMEDYLLTNKYFLSAYRLNLLIAQLMKGKQFMSAVKAFMEANPAYLGAAFDAIDREHGSFETYVRNGLGLSKKESDHLKNLYLE
jgi:protein-tyrosine phosphatase